MGGGDGDLDFLPVLNADFVFQSALHVQQAPPKDVQTLHSGTGKTNSKTELEQAMTVSETLAGGPLVLCTTIGVWTSPIGEMSLDALGKRVNGFIRGVSGLCLLFRDAFVRAW